MVGRSGLTLPLWRVIAGLGITQIIGWGTTFYLPAIMARPIAESLDLSPISVLGAYSWALLVSGLLSRQIGRAHV